MGVICAEYIDIFLSWRKNHFLPFLLSSTFTVCWVQLVQRLWDKVFWPFPYLQFLCPPAVACHCAQKPGAPEETSLGSPLPTGVQSVLCKLHGKEEQALSSNPCGVSSWAQECAPRSGTETFPKGTCASSTSWTQFLFKPFAVHVHPYSLWRSGASKRLQIHLAASGMKPMRLMEAAVMLLLMLPAVKKKLVPYPHLLPAARGPCHGQTPARGLKAPLANKVWNEHTSHRPGNDVTLVKLRASDFRDAFKTNILTAKSHLFQKWFLLLNFSFFLKKTSLHTEEHFYTSPKGSQICAFLWTQALH